MEIYKITRLLICVVISILSLIKEGKCLSTMGLFQVSIDSKSA